MKLNCKVGDLAVIVKSRAGNLGKVIRCIEFLGVVQYQDLTYEASWRSDKKMMSSDGTMSDVLRDSQLRPLRDSDEPDETLAWAGKPQEVKA